MCVCLRSMPTEYNTQRDTRDCPAKGKTGHKTQRNCPSRVCGTTGVCMIPTMLRTLCDPRHHPCSDFSCPVAHPPRNSPIKFMYILGWTSYFLSHGRRRIPETRQTSDPSRGLVQRMRLSSRHKALSGILFVGFSGSFFDKQASVDNTNTPPQFVPVEELGGSMMLLCLLSPPS